ncbi:MAG: hypothetical protein ACREDU_11090, partial [Methylocella sp.]
KVQNKDGKRLKMAGIRKQHGKELKLKFLLERLAGKKPVAQIVSDYTGCIRRRSGAGPFCA